MSAKAIDPEPLENSVLRSIRRMTRAVDIYSRKLRMSCKLTGPQLTCLRQLQSAGPSTLSRLATGVSLSAATVSGIVDRLEERSLVTRERQKQDKRRVLITLTRSGRKAVRRAPSSLQDNFSQAFNALPNHKQQELERALRQVVAMMEAEDLAASPLLISSGDLADSSRS